MANSGETLFIVRRNGFDVLQTTDEVRARRKTVALILAYGETDVISRWADNRQVFSYVPADRSSGALAQDDETDTVLRSCYRSAGWRFDVLAGGFLG